MINMYKTSLGKKLVVALSGAVLLGFVCLHMAGNLKAFGGMDAATGLWKLDIYARMLREIAYQFVGHETVLILTRIVLLFAVALHVSTIILLKRQAWRARPQGYAVARFDKATWASRFMFVGGCCMGLFIVLHILHLTTGHIHAQGFEEGKVYANITSAFSVWYITAAYVFFMAVLGLHVSHGLWSLTQTLGVSNAGLRAGITLASRVVGIVLFVGFVSVPVAVYCGFLPVADSSATIREVK